MDIFVICTYLPISNMGGFLQYTQKPTVPEIVHINIAILSSHVHKLILYNFVYLVVKKITCCLPNALYYIMVLDTAKTILFYLLKNEETILNYITR